MKKIRKMLDTKNYHLCEIYDGKNSWKLFEKHDGWIWDNSKPIMTSENNTYEELYEFVKTHRVIDLDKTTRKIYLIMLYIVIILLAINIIFVHSTLISGFIIGVEVMYIIYSLIAFKVSDSELKLLKLKCKEAKDKLRNQ